MTNPIRIGTRKSALALWQARWVQYLLEKQHCPSTLVSIESEGDRNLTQPVYAMGIQGVFTKALDAALLAHDIDIAVHSLKDVPTQLPEGIALTAVPSRGKAEDVLVFSPQTETVSGHGKIGTGSLRRKVQWLHRYPQSRTEDLRGNLQTRLEKLDASHWEGAIFARAGLERIELHRRPLQILGWMIPAPAQGAIGVCSRTDDVKINHAVKKIHCHQTGLCVTTERSFLKTLEGGCTAPIGAHAKIVGEKMIFRAGLFSLDGKEAVQKVWEKALSKTSDFGIKAAEEMRNKKGEKILEEIKKTTG